MPQINEPLMGRLHYHTGYALLQTSLKRTLINHLSKSESAFDIAWITGGELFGAEAIKALRNIVPGVVLYHNDDAFGRRDGNRWRSMLKAIPEYDLIALVRAINVAEAKALGGKHPVRVWMSYDEVAHAPVSSEEAVSANTQSGVVFIGTWMQERGPFMARLLQRGVPLSIYGHRWERAPEWPRLRQAFKGQAIVGRDYASAVAEAKICLGLLSKGNRDLHTRRSVEIPYSGGLLCAERTSEHLQMYRENEEAVFWRDADECADVCLRLLKSEAEIERIRVNGMRRVRQMRVGNEDICAEILDALYSGQSKVDHYFHTGCDE